MTRARFSPAALACIAETSADVETDVGLIRAGAISRDELLAQCLDGADEDRAEGWADYVDEVVRLAALLVEVTP